MDETGLYFRMMPAKSIAAAPIKGFKKLLARITLAFTVSADGEKLMPLVIGNAARPRSLRNFDTHQYVDYTHSKKSWMTSSIFNIYLSNLNANMKLNNNEILLLVDNCPAHKVMNNYSHIKVVFLPPNATGVVQSLDLGIIRSFKCKFRKDLIRRVVHIIETNDELSIIDAYKNITIKDAILFSYFACEEVEGKTIIDCFTKSPLFGKSPFELNDSIVYEDVKELENLLKTMNFEQNITIEDFIEFKEEE